MEGQVVVMVAVGLFVALFVTVSVWSGSAKRRDASRFTRVRRRAGRS